MKSKIVWITPEYFYDVDWPIVGQLKSVYEIRWYVVWGKESRVEVPKNQDIYKVIISPYRQRDLRIIKFYLSLINEIKKFDPEVLYNGYSGLPFFYPLLLCLFDRKKIIHEGHEIDPYVAIEHENLTLADKLTIAYSKYYLKRVGHTQVFSKHAVNTFKKLYPGSKCTYIPMVPKNFGKPMHIIEHGNKTVFLFFGKVYRVLKRFDLLLDAFLALDEKYMQQAELWVYGKCDRTERIKYEELIKGHNNIRAMFEFVPDNQIPDLFCSASFLVQPYQKITQSGPTMIAFNYNLPIIASNIEGFTERIKDGENGFLFEVDNVKDLKRVLENCIDLNETEYNAIKNSLKAFVEQEYSPTIVIKKYRDMLDTFINNCNK